ncbi:hypothetical protein ACWGH2_10545 [Streptomyces sp. NPDC054871]
MPWRRASGRELRPALGGFGRREPHRRHGKPRADALHTGPAAPLGPEQVECEILGMPTGGERGCARAVEDDPGGGRVEQLHAVARDPAQIALRVEVLVQRVRDLHQDLGQP